MLAGLTPVWRGQPGDPVHYVLELTGLADLRARYPAVLAARGLHSGNSGSASSLAGAFPALTLC